MPSSLTPRAERFFLLTLAGIQFSHILDFMIIMPLGPILMSAFGIGTHEFALLVASYSVSPPLPGPFPGTFPGSFTGPVASRIVCRRLVGQRLTLAAALFFDLAERGLGARVQLDAACRRLGPFCRPRHGGGYPAGHTPPAPATKVYVSRGLGGFPLRLGCAPEATIITQRRG